MRSIWCSRRQPRWAPFTPNLLETLIQAFKPHDIGAFLGRKLHTNYQDEAGNTFNTRILDTRIRHQMGAVSIKLYDKFGHILRIEGDD